MIPFNYYKVFIIKSIGIFLIISCCISQIKCDNGNENFLKKINNEENNKRENEREIRISGISPYNDVVRDVRADSRQSRIDSRDIRTDFREIRSELRQSAEIIRNVENTSRREREEIIDNNRFSNSIKRRGERFFTDERRSVRSNNNNAENSEKIRDNLKNLRFTDIIIRGKFENYHRVNGRNTAGISSRTRQIEANKINWTDVKISSQNFFIIQIILMVTLIGQVYNNSSKFQQNFWAKFSRREKVF